MARTRLDCSLPGKPCLYHTDRVASYPLSMIASWNGDFRVGHYPSGWNAAFWAERDFGGSIDWGRTV